MLFLFFSFLAVSLLCQCPPVWNLCPTLKQLMTAATSSSMARPGGSRGRRPFSSFSRNSSLAASSHSLCNSHGRGFAGAGGMHPREHAAQLVQKPGTQQGAGGTCSRRCPGTW